MLTPTAFRVVRIGVCRGVVAVVSPMGESEGEGKEGV